MSLERCYKGTKLYLKKGSIYIHLVKDILAQPTRFHGEACSSKDPSALSKLKEKLDSREQFKALKLFYCYLLYFFSAAFGFLRPGHSGCSPYHTAMTGTGFSMMPS